MSIFSYRSDLPDLSSADSSFCLNMRKKVDRAYCGYSQPRALDYLPFSGVYVSIKAQTIRDIANSKYFSDLRFLNRTELDLLILLTALSWRKRDKNNRYSMSGALYGLFPTPERHIAMLYDAGLFRDCTPGEIIAHSTIPELKALLAYCGLKAVGNRDALVAAANTVPDDAVASILSQNAMFVPSWMGLLLIRSYFVDSQTHLNDYAIPNPDLMITTRLDEQDAIDADLQRLQASFAFAAETSRAVHTFRTIATHYGDHAFIAAELSRAFGFTLSDSILLIRTEQTRLNVVRDMQSYQLAGIKYYEILACCDEDTCTRCSTLNKHRFLVSTAHPALNCPPFHLGCRCGTVACFDD